MVLAYSEVVDAHFLGEHALHHDVAQRLSLCHGPAFAVDDHVAESIETHFNHEVPPCPRYSEITVGQA